MAFRFTKESFEAFVKRMKAVEDRIQGVQLEDVQALGSASVSFLQSIFPKTKGPRKEFKAGATQMTAKTDPPLWRGWRTYPTSTNGNVGFLIKHARMGQDRISTILGALDQGSKPYQIRLQSAQAFRFQDARGAVLMRASTKGQFKTIKIPSRRARPTAAGYIKPTQEYIEENIEFLRLQVEADLEARFNRGDMIKQIANFKRAERLTQQ